MKNDVIPDTGPQDVGELVDGASARGV